MKNTGEIYNRTLTALVAGTLFFGAYILSKVLFGVLLFIILTMILTTEWPRLSAGKNWWLWFITPLYPIMPIATLFYLLCTFYTRVPLLPLYPFLIAWIGDTGAYCAGMAWGAHKICPRISPGKSWEGLAGGIAATFIANCALAYYTTTLTFLGISTPTSIIIFSIMITSIGFAGDTLESYFKRRVDLKDSGSLLPGHGGLLDRFDAVFFVAPIITLLSMLTH